MAANKRYPQAVNGPDLLPIDEDVDDEKCSPIKPVKRGKGEDSPFKRKLITSMHEEGERVIENGNLEKAVSI